MSMPQLMIGLDFHHPVNYACKGIENILRQPLALAGHLFLYSKVSRMSSLRARLFRGRPIDLRIEVTH